MFSSFVIISQWFSFSLPLSLQKEEEKFTFSNIHCHSWIKVNMNRMVGHLRAKWQLFSPRGGLYSSIKVIVMVTTRRTSAGPTGEQSRKKHWINFATRDSPGHMVFAAASHFHLFIPLLYSLYNCARWIILFAPLFVLLFFICQIKKK